MSKGLARLAFAVVCVLLARSTASALFLDPERRFDVRMRSYSQWSLMTESSSKAGCPDPAICPPKYDSGDLGQIRNFYNPELDAKLTDFTPFLDDFRFRFAWWGFYDGLYDSNSWAGTPWDKHRQEYKARFAQSDNPGKDSFVFADENKNPERIYAHRNRINELYLDMTKGPLFVRVGRQAISWGEADTIALLDIQNPFDLTQAAPGFFEDTDEARIPLWTLRGTYKLTDNLGPLSSTFLDAYIVPGPIDTTVPINPITAGISPFNPDVPDPQNATNQVVPIPPFNLVNPVTVPVHVSVVDRLPRQNWHNSRWGVRLTSVVARDYTVQTWFFRTFNQAPAPVLLGQGPISQVFLQGIKPTLIDDRGFRIAKSQCTITDPQTNTGITPSGRPCGRALAAVTVLDRGLESVVGAAATWFSEPLNAVIRTQLAFYLDEISFIPEKQLNPRTQLPKCSQKLADSGFLVVPGATCVNYKPAPNKTATADYMRFVLGYDRFFFFRPLNPTNSFTLVFSFNGQVNLSAIDGPDYRNPQPKHGHPQTRQANDNPLSVYIDPHDYEDQYLFEGFAQTALQTDYMHGRLTPRIIAITDVSGIFAFASGFTWRFTDNLLGSVNYLAITTTGRHSSIATFSAHDMVQFRLTAQLN